MILTGRQYLAIPGPSVVPDRVLNAMHRASPDIYTGELHEMMPGLCEDLKQVARTTHHVAIYVANGHGAWEAANTNLFSPGDHALALGDEVQAQIDVERRAATMRNHSATHLLHAVLREQLGGHVAQKGSLVAPDRLRFDFSHPEPVTAEQLADIERIVNAQVLLQQMRVFAKTQRADPLFVLLFHNFFRRGDVERAIRSA